MSRQFLPMYSNRYRRIVSPSTAKISNPTQTDTPTRWTIVVNEHRCSFPLLPLLVAFVLPPVDIHQCHSYWKRYAYFPYCGIKRKNPWLRVPHRPWRSNFGWNRVRRDTPTMWRREQCPRHKPSCYHWPPPTRHRWCRGCAGQ